MNYRNDSGSGSVAVLNDAELLAVAGGRNSASDAAESVWHDIGYAMADGYFWARDQVSRFYEWLLG